jgi:hypothetical protein
MRYSFSNFGFLFFAFIFVICMTLFTNRVETYQDNKIDSIRAKLIQIDPRAKELVFQASHESFTENKKYVYLCLKDKDGNYYDDNMLMYVSLHELAHAFSESVDTHHTGDEFKNNFKELLRKAEQLGYYNPSTPLNYDYCPKQK